MIARARELSNAGRRADALLEYDKALAIRSDQARLLIERGRLLAQLGQTARADADFQAAARLAPENPQLFVDAGSWIAGPYPIGFNGAGALESSLAPDPSKPAPASGNETHRWFDVPTGALGLVNIGELFHADNAVAYVMTIVYSTERRKVVLLMGNDDTARVRNNAKQVYLSKLFAPPQSIAFFMTLEAGRNTILAKVTNTTREHSLSLRFGSTPIDSGRAYAQAKNWKEAALEFTKVIARDPDNADPAALVGLAEALVQLARWKEAAAIFERIAARDSGNINKQTDVLKCYLALKDYGTYKRLCEAQIARHGKTKDRNLANNIIWQAALIPEGVRNYGQIIDIGRDLTSSRSATASEFNTFGAVLYRAGQYSGSLTFLKKSIDAQKGKGNAWDWVFTAMARHRSRQPGDRDALDRHGDSPPTPGFPGKIVSSCWP